jgi:hypothetical protein
LDLSAHGKILIRRDAMLPCLVFTRADTASRVLNGSRFFRMPLMPLDNVNFIWIILF